MSEQAVKRVKRRRKASDEQGNKGPVLPAEMFDLVIGHMDVNELLTCRMVCKYFKQVIDRIRIQSLAIAESEDSTYKSVLNHDRDDYDYNATIDYERFSDHFYFVSNEPVYESHTLIHPDTAAGLRILLNCLDLSKLRRLLIVEIRDGKAHFGLLNRLVQLEHLQIASIDLECKLRLQLPNLRTLSIAKVNCADESDFQISLATPNLEHFETHWLGGRIFCFEHPASVRLIQLYSVNRQELRQLVNLEVLICEDPSSLVFYDYEEEEWVSMDLSPLEKLKRVDCARMVPGEIRELCGRCHHHRVDFYFCGLKIDYLEKDLEYQLDMAGRKDCLKLVGAEQMFDAYDQLADALYFCEGIRYFKYFFNRFPSSLPENFASKFYSVREVYVAREIENVDYFLEFLRCFRNLKVLWLHCSMLKQEFFDQHSHLFGRIQEFRHTHNLACYCAPNDVNLKFILNFKYLENLETDERIGIALLTEAFNSLTYLKQVTFWSMQIDMPSVSEALNFRITRKENEFEVHCFDPRRPSKNEFSSRSEMVKFVEQQFPGLSAPATS